jgi:hypothetical protein
MSQRTWFTRDNTANLLTEDLRILNRAARNIWKPGREPRHSDLTALRMNYRPGMSAADLLEAVEGALP